MKGRAEIIAPAKRRQQDESMDSALAAIIYRRAAPRLCVSGIQAAEDFYSRVLGFEKIFENGDPVDFMVMKRDRTKSIRVKPAPKGSTVNVMHMSFSDVAMLSAVREAECVRIIKSLADKVCGQRAFAFAAPDGDRIDIGERRS